MFGLEERDIDITRDDVTRTRPTWKRSQNQAGTSRSCGGKGSNTNRTITQEVTSKPLYLTEQI